VAALFFLAPWTAECSWGGFTAQEFLFVVVILGPLYGGAAILIREYARRTGAGWPAIILLAAAFGVVQAGLVDQSLFNTDFLDDTQFAGSDPDAVSYIGNHVALSICAPIALVEAFSSARQRPWLGPVGIAVTAVLYVLGSLLIFFDDGGRKGFMASPAQLIGATAAAVVLIGLAMLPRWRRQRPPLDAPAPRPLWTGLLVGAAYSAPGLTTHWYAVAVAAVAATVLAVVLSDWSRRSGWGPYHVLAAATTPMVIVAAEAYAVPTYAPSSAVSAVVGDIAISVIVAALVVGAFRRLRRADQAIPAA
jgi:hypothetical protein